MYRLSELGFSATGTLRSNRAKNLGSLMEVKPFDKASKRGAYDYRFETDNELLVVCWKDSAIVTIITNFGSIEPTNKVRRFCSAERKYVNVEQPNVLKEYNKSMGGVDLVDSMISTYRCTIQGKKWHWNIFINSLYQIICYSYRFYSDLHAKDPDRKLTFLEFRRMIATTLLKRSANLRAHKEGSESSMRSTSQKNTVDIGTHLVKRSDSNKRRRCKHCTGQSLYLYQICEVPSHP